MNEIKKADEILRIYNRLDKNDKELMILLLLNDRRYSNIVRVISTQYADIRRIIENNNHSFGADFAANIAGNIVTDGLFFVLSRLFRK